MPTLVSESKDLTHELWTAADFLDWLQPGVHADLIDGEKFMHSPVSIAHAKLLNFVDRLLGRYIEHHDLGQLFREVVAVRLGSRNVFLADLVFVPKAQEAELQANCIPFAPPFVVEALSPYTGNRDVGPKFAAYEEHGVQEYGVLDPQTLAHRFYRRGSAEDVFVEFAENEERIASEVLPGFFVKRSWLDPEALPSVSECFAEIIGA